MINVLSEDLKSIIKTLPRLTILLLPFVILFGIPTAIFLLAGEQISIQQIIQQQMASSKTTLLGKAYSYPDPLYKWESTKRRTPTVLALGTSRVLAFRSKFFKESQSFFNAGKGVEVVEDFNTFLEGIAIEHQPKIIIVGLDQHLFFRNGTSLQKYVTARPLIEVFLTHTWRQIYLDLFKQKFNPIDLFRASSDERSVGLTALLRHDGYRNDGSYQYGDPTKQSLEARKNVIDSEALSVTPEHCLEYEDQINPSSLESLSRFLKTSRERGITIVGFIPPYAHELYEKMRNQEDSACAAFIDGLPQILKPLFEEHEFELYDFTDNTSFGGSDREMVDTAHAGEKSYLRLFLKMLKEGQALRPYADAAILEDSLKTTEGDLDVFFHEY